MITISNNSRIQFKIHTSTNFNKHDTLIKLSHPFWQQKGGVTFDFTSFIFCLKREETPVAATTGVSFWCTFEVLVHFLLASL